MSEVLDTRGLKCPLPALKAEKRLEGLIKGARLTVLASDPMAKVDIPFMCRRRGFRVIAESEAAGELRFEVEA